MAQQSNGAPAWLAACLGWAAGTAAQLQQAALWSTAGYAALAVAALVLLACLGRRRGRRGVVGLACALLAFALCGARALLFLAGALDPALEGRDLRVTGTVVAMPQPTETGLRFRLQVEGASDQGRPVQLPPRIELGWYRGMRWSAGADGVPEAALQHDSTAMRAGDRWQLQVRLRAPHGNRNPHGFDYELWLWERGVQATGTVRAGPRDAAPQRLSAGWRHPVERLRQAVREAIYARLDARGVAGVVAALAIGDQGAIERADWDLFRATGIAHLVSVSGLHVTMFAWLAAAVVGWAWRHADRLGWRACLWCPAQHAALVGGVLLATLYALFSGWGVPAQRTVAMLAVVALLRLSGRAWPWPMVWLLALAAVLLLDPWALLQPGLWLSFVAVGVLFATDGGRPAPAEGVLRRGGGALAGLLREQAVVTLALAPLSLLLFQQVSIIGLLANLVAIPWVTLVVTPLALAGVLLPPLWDLAGGAVAGLLMLLSVLAQWPWAVFSGAAPPLALGIAGLAGAVLLAMRLPLALRAMGLPLLLPALLWQAPRPAPGAFELLAADIGQGNAVLVRTARHALLYDTGPRYGLASDAGHRVLVPLLRALDERLDAVVVSHGDIDHAGGAEAVLAMQPQAQLRASLPPDHALQAARPLACAAGQRWQWDGVEFELLHPPSDASHARAKANAMSCVLRVRSASGAAALLAGDIEQPQEAQLLAAPQALRAELLLVPHHGSATSSSAAFLAAVAPRFAVVQAGYRNRFGHPAADVVARLQAQGSTVVDTTRCGAATWRSDVPGRIECERERRARYWQHRLP